MAKDADPNRPVLFLSHAAADGEMARFLKEGIQLAFDNLDVFVSSDPEDLPIGDPWVQEILEALERARLVAVLTTERGLGRKWVWFEAGAGWDRRGKIVSCCVGKVRKGALPPPFNIHTAVDIDETDGLNALLDLLAREFGKAVGRFDQQQWLDELRRLDVRAEERHKFALLEAGEKPFLDHRKKAVQAKLHDLSQGGRDLLRFVMTYGEVDNSRIYEAWRRPYDAQHTITKVLESGLAKKRIERVGSIEVAWHLSVNPHIEALLKIMLFPSEEQDINPYFQA